VRWRAIFARRADVRHVTLVAIALPVIFLGYAGQQSSEGWQSEFNVEKGKLSISRLEVGSST
jgi:hypothetical protein